MPEKKYTRREILRLGLGALVAPAAASVLSACSSGPEERVVNFYNWSRYIGKDTLAKFTAETGIKVNYEEMADEEELFAKLRSGARGYDLIVGTDYMMPRLKAMNLVDAYPPGVLKNAGNIDKKFRDTPYDPDNAFTVPYLWGTTGIGYSKKLIAKAPSSWTALWDAKYSGKIAMLDNARDCVSTALLLKGYSETTADDKQLDEAKALLLQQRPLVKQYSSSTYMDSLLAGEVSLCMAWSGDVLQVSRENPHLDYVIPNEGSYMWVDNLCLVRGSQHREDTLRLVDYLLRADVAADIANTVRYASPNAAAFKHLDPALSQDPRVFPPKSMQEILRFHSLLDPATEQAWNDLWQDVKVG